MRILAKKQRIALCLKMCAGIRCFFAGIGKDQHKPGGGAFVRE
jgi:hypothetical protein